MSRAARAVESKAVVRIEVAASPRPCLAWAALWCVFCDFLVGEAYTPQGRAHSRRTHTPGAARPAPMGRAARAVESKAGVRIEVAASPRPCLGCAVELVLCVAPRDMNQG
jgi:hypothetical protein